MSTQRSLPIPAEPMDLDAPHVLIADDDALLRDMLGTYLRNEGLRVTFAPDGPAVLAAVAGSPVDIILLDLLMPGGDGLSLLRQIRRHADVGIIIVTSRDDVIDRVAGLEAGADDYLSKPAHPREVLARIRTILRRLDVPTRQAAAEPEEVFLFGSFELYREQRRLVGAGGMELRLTSGEFDLLLAFVTHPGRPLSRNRLMDLVKGPGWVAYDRSIDQQVARLRRKIEDEPTSPSLVRSIRGVGYLFAGTVKRR